MVNWSLKLNILFESLDHLNYSTSRCRYPTRNTKTHYFCSKNTINPSLQVFSIMASAVEYGPAEVASYFHPQIEQLISKFGQKQDWTTVHRVIFYTINLIAQKKVPGGVFDAFFKTQIPFLKSYAENSASTMDEATQNAVDNSISALISIMRHSPQVYGAEFDSFAQYALSHLPFRYFFNYLAIF